MLALARRTTLAVAAAVALLSGCSVTGGSCSGLGAALLGAAPAEASCAAGIEYDDRFYLEGSDRVRLSRGGTLSGAVIPGCNDIGSNCQWADEPDQPIRAWAVRGVSRRVMVLAVEPGSGRLAVFVRRPAAQRRYLHLVDGRWELRRQVAERAR